MTDLSGLIDLADRLSTGYVDEKSQRHRLLIPGIAIWAAAVTGCPLVHACTLLDKESNGGHNVFSASGWIKGDVTQATYATYLAGRPTKGAVGVGPMQLTWPALQDRADLAGGCWRPEINTLVGLAHFADLLNGRPPGVAYSMWHNGTVVSDSYSADALTRVTKWLKVIAAPGNN